MSLRSGPTPGFRSTTCHFSLAAQVIISGMPLQDPLSISDQAHLRPSRTSPHDGAHDHTKVKRLHSCEPMRPTCMSGCLGLHDSAHLWRRDRYSICLACQFVGDRH